MKIKPRELVIIESPWKSQSVAEQLRNRRYALLAVHDSIDRGESPYASHLFFTQVFNEENMFERNLGIDLGLMWGLKSDKTVVYQDFGITSGMNCGIRAAIASGHPVEYRNIPNALDSQIISLEALALEISDFFGVRLKDLKHSSRGCEEVSSARIVYYAVARKMFKGLSFGEIGNVVNRRYSTCINGIKNLKLKTHLTLEFDRYCTEKKLKFE